MTNASHKRQFQMRESPLSKLFAALITMECISQQILGRDKSLGCVVARVARPKSAPNRDHSRREGRNRISADPCTSNRERDRFLPLRKLYSALPGPTYAWNRRQSLPHWASANQRSRLNDGLLGI